MGQVFLAEHMVLGRRAAIKVLHPELCRETESLGRFFNEARASASLHHPGLIDVYDFGRDDQGNAFIVMELLEGVSLRDLLTRQKQLPPALAVGVARQVAEAMSAAHEHGIVHRDLKPENLFLVPDAQIPLGWRAKVLDFGIAKLYGDGMQNAITTRTGNILGTPTYMAPEQCHGASHVDSRCDIYSLGCILFEMLCGQPPFVSDGVGAIIAAHMFEAPPLPSDLMPGLPLELDQAVLALLAKAPDERVATMPDVITLLSGLALADISDQPELLAWSNTLAVGTSQTPLPHGTTPRGPRTPRGSVPPPAVVVRASAQAMAQRPSREAPVAVATPRPSTSAPTLRTPVSLPVAPPAALPGTLNTLDAAAIAVAPAPRTGRRRRRSLVWVALAVSVASGATLWLSYLRGQAPRAATALQMKRLTPADPPAPTPLPSATVVPAPAAAVAAAPAGSAIAAEPDTVSVRIETVPPDALVTRERDGVVLGRTPLELHLAREGVHLAVALEKEGFRTSRAELSLDRDGSALVELIPAPAAKPGHRHAPTPAPKATSTAPAPAPTPAPAKPIKDGTLDPYGN